MLNEGVSVLINLVEKNGHVVSSSMQDRVVQHFAQPVQVEFVTSFANASRYHGQDTSKKLGCATGAAKQHTFQTCFKEPGDVSP